MSSSASSLCWRLLSASAFTSSASCHASASPRTSALHCAPLVRLVVAFPSTSASPSCCTTAWGLGLHHLSRLHVSPHPSHLVGCCIPQRPIPPLVVVHLSSCSCLSATTPAALSILYNISSPRAGAGPPWTLMFPLLLRWVSIASAELPPPLPPLRAPSREPVVSAGPPLPLPLSSTYPQGVSPRREWVQVDDAQLGAPLASCDKTNPQLM